MTAQDRFAFVIAGKPVAPPLTLSWRAHVDADAVVDGHGKGLQFAEIVNPFGLAIERRLDLSPLLARDPAAAGIVIDGLTEEVRIAIQRAIESGAAGVLYRLHGATARHCTPMEYGGYFLERDRELLGALKNSAITVLFVVASEEPYLDLLGDLPSDVFGWDAACGATVSDVRAIRKGALLAEIPDADVLLQAPAGLSQLLEDPKNAYVSI